MNKIIGKKNLNFMLEIIRQIAARLIGWSGPAPGLTEVN